ncbi:ATP-binding protein [Afifella sp. IM 167]|uniref:ATP-binding protein n=1 Tax=Afifella sp. IM 167 TaxID=2033586 RepID=UPI001CCE7541|nr:HAMP domain-containing sensor histidine kinase [Afifella sp. IM 167]MBZ8134422.1 two-component sensor histidine kinase [Afifella sp. IM 167]
MNPARGGWLGRAPITVKAPVVAALLMAIVGVVASERVLSRLVAIQERQINELTSAYLEGLASPLTEPVLRRDPWEIFNTLDQARHLSSLVRPVETVVSDAEGHVLAGSDPRARPIGSRQPAMAAPAGGEGRIAIDEEAGRAFVSRSLAVEGTAIGTLYSEFDISELLAERQDALWTLLATNAGLTLGFMFLGWFAVRRMVRPMKVLSDHLAQSPEGGIRPISPRLFPRLGSEAGHLFRRFNQMAEAVNENAALAARLAEEQRLAGLGRLTSGMAHEINNPLGGLLNAVDTLRRHGDKPMVRTRAVSLIERGLSGIRDVVQAALATYREKDGGRQLSLQDFEDVRILLQPELRRHAQNLDWHIEATSLPSLPGNPIRQTLLNLLLNASAASGEGGRLSFRATTHREGGLCLEVADSGPGLPAAGAALLTGDGASAILGDGKGLGLWMVRRLVDEIGGTIEVGGSDLGGTSIRLELKNVAMERHSNAA